MVQDFDTTEIRSEIPGNFWSVVLEKDAEYKLTHRVRNEEALKGDRDERNILQIINRRKADWIGHVLRRNCFLENVIEGNIDGKVKVTERR